jgi:hypothetical protein
MGIWTGFTSLRVRVQWRAFVKTVTKLRITSICETFTPTALKGAYSLTQFLIRLHDFVCYCCSHQLFLQDFSALGPGKPENFNGAGETPRRWICYGRTYYTTCWHFNKREPCPTTKWRCVSSLMPVYNKDRTEKQDQSHGLQSLLTFNSWTYSCGGAIRMK